MRKRNLLGVLVLVSVLAVSCASRSSVNAFGPYSAAETYYKRADYPMAIAKYNEYLAENPRGNLAATATYYIAKSYVAAGDEAKALEYYARVVKEFPGTSWAEFSKDQLAVIQSGEQV